MSEVLVDIPMGINCAPLVADLVLFCYERDFMLSLSDNNQTDSQVWYLIVSIPDLCTLTYFNNQTDIIEPFNSISRYLDDLLNIDNPYFEQNVSSDISYRTSVK